MRLHLISVSGLLSLAACAAGPERAIGTAADPSVTAPAEIGIIASGPGAVTSTVRGEEDGDLASPPVTIGDVTPPFPTITSMVHGEEEGGGTQVSTMALGEEDAPWPPITSLAHGEEEGGGGTMISDEPIDLSELRGLDARSSVSDLVSLDQVFSVAMIMAKLRQSQG